MKQKNLIIIVALFSFVTLAAVAVVGLSLFTGEKKLETSSEAARSKLVKQGEDSGKKIQLRQVLPPLQNPSQLRKSDIKFQILKTDSKPELPAGKTAGELGSLRLGGAAAEGELGESDEEAVAREEEGEEERRDPVKAMGDRLKKLEETLGKAGEGDAGIKCRAGGRMSEELEKIKANLESSKKFYEEKGRAAERAGYVKAVEERLKRLERLIERNCSNLDIRR